MTALSSPPPADNALRREIENVVLAIEVGSRTYPDVIAAALLPVVARRVQEARADELERAANAVERQAYANRPETGSHGGGLMAATAELLDRAKALRTTPTNRKEQET